ncbi:AAA family ATPase [Sinorhizobium meliloti]|nr:AAA family ATPase [Sinorhizobium meliloti]UIJ95463.1 AAA family ATPase [Sinorhizobium meliloti]WKL31903.1 AAA family ATPase [Sinorhizobium meliloti]WKL37651.1 AAA family ATPase [Sinorhizobium meliloti]
MSEIFLRSVELANFRVYGDSYVFEFPAEPGVTLITGANGLGKTSFFDGVEWALTGQVSRFSDIRTDNRRREADPLTRVGAPENSHRVALAFTAGDPIDRGCGFLPTEEEVAALLKQERWPAISNLHGYLSITHFLGQASTRRFSLREPKAQWEALKGPAGVDRINSLRERVSGQGARQAFTRAIRDRTMRLEKATEALRSWRSLIEDRDRLAFLSNSERSLSPQQVLEECEQITAQLAALLPSAQLEMVGRADEPESALKRLSDLIEEVRQYNRTEQAKSRALEAIVAAYERSLAETAAKSALVKEIGARRIQLVDDLAKAEAALNQASTAHGRSKQLAAQLMARSAMLVRVEAAMAQLHKATAAIAEAAQQLSASKAEEDKAQRRREDVQSQIDNVKVLRAERSRASAQLSQAQKRVQISTALSQTRLEIARLIPLISARDAEQPGARRSEIVNAQSAIKAEIDGLNTELRKHDERGRLLAEAIASIAHQLSHEDESCPICDTRFPPGRLKDLAEAHARAGAAPASGLAANLALARSRYDELLRQQSELDRALADLGQLSASLATQQEREARLVQALVEAGGAVDARYDESSIVAARMALASLDERIANSPTEEGLDSLLAEAQATMDAERARQGNIDRQRVNAIADAEAARSTLGQHPDVWAPDRGLIISLVEQLAATRAEAARIGEKVQDDQAKIDAARLGRDAITDAIANEDASLSATNRELDREAELRRDLLRQWNDAGQTGDPDPERVAQISSRISERAVRIDPIAFAHAGLIDGLRIWQNDQRLQEREHSIAATLANLELSTIPEVTARFTRDIAAIQEELDLAQKARARMEDVGQRMQQRAEEFADDVLKPLNETIQRFALPLMTWTDASIIYRAEHHATRSELKPAIVRTGPDGKVAQLEMNPNLYFSEGQLSALSVSALLAASTTFSWSRWRGLLLDDPLQHNDVIHASAFMDLIRQMVRELRYQVILSTHDSTEAEFLVRKCKSAGIPFAIHELVPRGDDGLISEVA